MSGPTLLIGGMGFIGLHTARRFLDAGQNDVVLTYHQNRREPDFLKPDLGKRAQVERMDVLDAANVADVITRHAVDSVVYLAVPALNGVSPAEEFQTNTAGYLNVLEACRAAGVRRHSSVRGAAVRGVAVVIRCPDAVRSSWFRSRDVAAGDRVGVARYLRNAQSVSLFAGPLALGVAVPHMHRDAPLEVRERKGRLAVAAVCGTEKREQRRVLIDWQ